MTTIDINKNVSLCISAAGSIIKEMQARDSDIALIKSKLGSMTVFEKGRAERTIDKIRKGLRRYDGNEFKSQVKL